VSRGKGVVLVSGGLDSLLAARVLMEQDLELFGFHAILPFIAPDADPADLKPVQSASRINLTTHVHRCNKEYIDIIRNPAHGYGKHSNPCIDCHIYFIKKAADLMRELEADFVATGEVVGQRPMSQMKHTMNHIEKVAGLSGRLIRPLSAKLLKPTILEQNGIVNRDMLLDINGRSRKVQFELARMYAIDEYQSPSGGCLFTDRFISQRVQDLIARHSEVEPVDFYLLTIGRHFRISNDAKIIVSRSEQENNELEKYRYVSDYFFIPDFKGPAVFVKGMITDDDMAYIGSIMLRYGKAGRNQSSVTVYNKDTEIKKITVLKVTTDEQLEKLRI
jgi:tRNA U34 2-thiouridine synthase MnmA/TrmU